jgi:hypothetical protein
MVADPSLFWNPIDFTGVNTSLLNLYGRISKMMVY